MPVSRTRAQTQLRVCIIGVGNAYRGDDAVGLIAAREIHAKNLPDVTVVEANGEGVALIETWREADAVILIDAVHAKRGAPPGTIYRFDVDVEPLPVDFFHYSTHAFGVAEAIELARVLNRLPPRMLVYGVEGGTFGTGMNLSDEIERAAQTVVERVLRDIRSLGARDS